MAVTIRGTSTFIQRAPERWYPSRYDLDRLIVPKQGDTAAFDTFVAALSVGAASSIDSHMYLDSWSNDSDRVFPTVELTYIGKKGGVLPNDKDTPGSGEQQARYTSYTGKTWVQVTYMQPSMTRRHWSNDMIDPNDRSGDPVPDDLTLTEDSIIDGQAHSDEGVTTPTTLAEFFAFFVVTQHVSGTCEEYVPSHYYLSTITKVARLTSIQA